MRFARGDVRDHIVSHRNDHGPSYRPYRRLQRSRRLKIDFREIFGVVRFSTFATVSAQSGRNRRVGECPLLRDERTSIIRGLMSAHEQLRHFAVYGLTSNEAASPVRLMLYCDDKRTQAAALAGGAQRA
jgi:hypothetical protein